MNEFNVINQYFNWGNQHNNGLILGVGDDGAICQIPSNHQLVTSNDTSILGVHFSNKTSPSDIAYKSLAVNLSDMAAMGVKPRWFNLALTLPDINLEWLREFSQSLKSLAKQFEVNLIGGDTTHGHLSIGISIMGVVANNQALLRSSAEVGDGIFVSNTLGDAALAWQLIQAGQPINNALSQALNRPEPQVELGLALQGIANACIDISDGLLADLNHILNASQVGASIDAKKIALSNSVKTYIKQSNNWCLPLASGDDYQLCWTVPANKYSLLKPLMPLFNFTQIGVITQNKGLVVHNADVSHCKSYEHFSEY